MTVTNAKIEKRSLYLALKYLGPPVQAIYETYLKENYPDTYGEIRNDGKPRICGITFERMITGNSCN